MAAISSFVPMRRSTVSLYDRPCAAAILYDAPFSRLYDPWALRGTAQRPGGWRSVALPSVCWPAEVVRDVVEALADLLVAAVRGQTSAASSGGPST